MHAYWIDVVVSYNVCTTVFCHFDILVKSIFSEYIRVKNMYKIIITHKSYMLYFYNILHLNFSQH